VLSRHADYGVFMAISRHSLYENRTRAWLWLSKMAAASITPHFRVNVVFTVGMVRVFPGIVFKMRLNGRDERLVGGSVRKRAGCLRKLVRRRCLQFMRTLRRLSVLLGKPPVWKKSENQYMYMNYNQQFIGMAGSNIKLMQTAISAVLPSSGQCYGSSETAMADFNNLI